MLSGAFILLDNSQYQVRNRQTDLRYLALRKRSAELKSIVFGLLVLQRTYIVCIDLLCNVSDQPELLARYSSWYHFIFSSERTIIQSKYSTFLSADCWNQPSLQWQNGGDVPRRRLGRVPPGPVHPRHRRAEAKPRW